MKKRRDSSIPYAQRLQLKKADEIMAQRNEAATVALGIMMCSLADRYGFGYTRLYHLAQDTMQNIRDFYAGDSEMEVEHLRARLRQLGFTVSPDGRIYGTADPDGNPVPPAKRKPTEGGNNERASQEEHP